MPYNDLPYDQTTNRFGAAPATNTSQLRNWRQIYDPTAEVPPWMAQRVADSAAAVNAINRMPHMFTPDQYVRAPADQWKDLIGNDIWGQGGTIAQRMSGSPPNQFQDIFASPSSQGLGQPLGAFGLPSNLVDLSQQPGLLDAIRKRIADAVAGVTASV